MKILSAISCFSFFAVASAAFAQQAPASAHDVKTGAKQIANLAASSAKNEVKGLWANAPEWLSRTEWDLGWNDQEGLEYQVLTTQPIYQSADKKSTFFTQASYFGYELYDIRRQTANLGLGYRHLLLDNTLLLGGNTFGDYEFNYNHKRWSVGAEAKYGALDLAVNRYIGLGGVETVKSARERVMSGYDGILSLPLPYLPWTKVNGRYFVWEKEVGRNDTTGNEFSAELNLHPNLALVGGTRNDNRNPRESYAMLQVRLGDNGKPTLASKPVSNLMWDSRDLRDETLTKVRRENRIVTERVVTNAGGVTVVVKKG